MQQQLKHTIACKADIEDIDLFVSNLNTKCVGMLHIAHSFAHIIPLKFSQSCAVQLHLEPHVTARVILYIPKEVKGSIDIDVNLQKHSNLEVASVFQVTQSINVGLNMHMHHIASYIQHSSIYHVADGGELNVQHKQVHTASDTSSFSTIHGIAQKNTRINFNGLIHLQKKSSNAQAALTHKVLNLGQGNAIRSVPNLEIEHNDVMCQHATAIEHVQQEDLFYLMSKGFKKEAAQRMLAQGFCNQAFNTLHEKSMFKDSVLSFLHID